MSAGPILFAGDPHRNFSPILRACLERHPGTLILLGDCDCPAPLPHILAPAIEAGWDVKWILGNHDTETETAFDNLVTAHPQGDIGARVIEVNGVRIAGLAGVFKPRVWHPGADAPGGAIEPPRFQSRAAFLQTLRPDQLWRGGMPMWHRDTIFPEDFDRLSSQRFDVLVSHEAPTSHAHGFAAIDDLALAGGARLIVHGHHHQSYHSVLANGISVRGLTIAEPWVLPP